MHNSSKPQMDSLTPELQEQDNNTEAMELQPPPLSASSRFNIKMMKRSNILAITVFVGGILYKHELVWSLLKRLFQ